MDEVRKNSNKDALAGNRRDIWKKRRIKLIDISILIMTSENSRCPLY